MPTKGEETATTASAPGALIVLKKNQALGGRTRLEEGNFELTMLRNPLHDTKVLHHLHKCDEEDDGGQNAGEEPACLLVEEGCTDSGFLQEVRGEESKPSEEFKANTGFEGKDGDSLLEKETDNDRLPVNKFNSGSQTIC